MAIPCTDDSEYREYLDFFDDDRRRRPKLSRARFFECDEELIDLIALESIRKHSQENRERQNFLLYLLQSSGTRYGNLSPAYKLELARMIRAAEERRNRPGPIRQGRAGRRRGWESPNASGGQLKT